MTSLNNFEGRYQHLERQLLAQCQIDPQTRWVNFTATRNIPWALIRACAESLAVKLRRYRSHAIMVPAARDWPLAPALATILDIDWILYLPSTPFPGASMFTAPNITEGDYQTGRTYYMIPPPPGVELVTFVGDFIETGATAIACIRHAQETYGLKCVAAAFLLEIAEGGGIKRLKELMGSPYPIWCMARIETGRYKDGVRIV